jgi:EmrB/QacA subfamily drug resistance transporter
MHQAQPDQQQPSIPSNKWLVLVIVSFGFFMILLDTTVINVALQTLHEEFQSSLQQTQWIISVYVLAMGIVMPLSGYLSRRFGSRRIYLLGLGIFGLGSFLCGLSNSITQLILFRIIQGIGGGITSPLGIALLLQSFQVKEHGTALGYYGIVSLVAPALGPILGGFLVSLNLWRVIFFINPPIAVISILLSIRFLNRDTHSGPKSLDLAGIIAEVIGFGSVLMGATLAATIGWLARETLSWFGLGILGLVAFIIIELWIAKEPILDLRLFGNRIYLNASLLGYVSVLALFGAEFLLPLYLQSLRGLSPLQTGLTLLPMAISSGLMVILSGRIYDRIGPRLLMIVGFSLLAVNTWQFSNLQADTPILWIMELLVLRGVALGLTVQTTMATAMSVIKPHDLPRGTSLSNSTRQVAQSIAVAILATILVSTLSPEVRDYENRLNAQATTSTIANGRQGLCTPVISQDTSAAPSSPDIRLQQQACTENMAGFDRTYKLTFYASLVALLLGMFLPGWPFKWRGRHRMIEYV